jgi:hypothetical protein
MPPSDQKLIGLERGERLFANLEIVFKLVSNLSQHSTLTKIKPPLSPSTFALQAKVFVV